MRVTVLGMAPGKSIPGLHHAAILVQVGDTRLLLDCGEGITGSLLQNGLAPDDLDAVVISHLHPDHVSGLFMLIQNFLILRRSKHLPVFLPEKEIELARMFDLFYTFPGRLPFTLSFLPMEELSRMYPFMTAVPSDHLASLAGWVREHGLDNSLRAWSFVIDDLKRTVYTSDITTADALIPYLSTTDLLLIDGQHPMAEVVVTAANNIRGMTGVIHGMSGPLQTRLAEISNLRTIIEGEPIEI
jgi:hypothetical protein